MKEYAQLFLAFFRIGALTFGGGYSMLPMLERELVLKYRWSTMEEIMDYFAVGQCIPGIIAANTAVFVGYKRKKILGGIVAALGVITPSIAIILLLAGLLEQFGDNHIVQSAFRGVSAAVAALIVQAVFKMGKTGIRNLFGAVLAVAAFSLVFFLKASPILVVVGAGLIGVLAYSKRGRRLLGKALKPFRDKEARQ